MEAAPHRFSGYVPEVSLRWRLRMAREAAQLEQIQLANLMQISPRSVVNYEKGYTAPRWPVLLAWANATGVDVIWLRDGAESTATPCPSCGQPTHPDHPAPEGSTEPRNRCCQETPSVRCLSEHRHRRAADRVEELLTLI